MTDLENQIKDMDKKLIELNNKRTNLAQENNQNAININNFENNYNKINQTINEQLNNINYIKDNYKKFTRKL